MQRMFNIPITLRILIALVVIQVLTVLLYIAWTRTDSTDSLLAFALLALAAAFFAALWLGSMTRSHHARDVLLAKEALRHERERSRRLVEEQKTQTRESVRRQMTRDFSRQQNRSRLKLYGAFAGMGGIGLLLILTQFLSLGIVLLSSSGGALAGYLLRIRQETQRRRSAAEPEAAAPKIIGAPDNPRLIRNTDTHRDPQ
jgi:hypothetical protein